MKIKLTNLKKRLILSFSLATLTILISGKGMAQCYTCDLSKHSKSLQVQPYECPDQLSDEVWGKVQPYLLPTEHPAKMVLDSLAKERRLIASKEALTQAGFVLQDRPKRRMIVAKHPLLKGYLVKTYLDFHNLYGQDYSVWKHRCEGARQIQASIDKHRYNHLMKTPNKWLYLLPSEPPPEGDLGIHPQSFMLVVEDMKILSKEKNEKKFKNGMTKEMLEALVVILNENKLIDSIHLSNIPFCKDGRIAFIDTEHFNTNRRKVRYERLLPFLSSEMQKHLKNCVKKHTKKKT